jgi:hypothetical protein
MNLTRAEAKLNKWSENGTHTEETTVGIGVWLLGEVKKGLAEIERLEAIIEVTSGEPVTLQAELASVINRHSLENDSNTQDFLLAAYLVSCLEALTLVVNSRDELRHRREPVEALTHTGAYEHMREKS